MHTLQNVGCIRTYVHTCVRTYVSGICFTYLKSQIQKKWMGILYDLHTQMYTYVRTYTYSVNELQLIEATEYCIAVNPTPSSTVHM